MTGFKSLGGFSFPTRAGMAQPNSSVVQSDTEFLDGWNKKIAETPAFFDVELAPNNGQFDASAAAPWQAEQNKTLQNIFRAQNAGSNANFDQIFAWFDKFGQGNVPGVLGAGRAACAPAPGTAAGKTKTPVSGSRYRGFVRQSIT